MDCLSIFLGLWTFKIQWFNMNIFFVQKENRVEDQHLLLLKVSKDRNSFMTAWFLPRYQRNFLKDSSDLNPFKFTSHQRNWFLVLEKKVSNFGKLQFLNSISYSCTKKHLALGKIGVSVNFIIHKLKSCKIAFFVSQFLWLEVNLRGLRGNLKQKNLVLKVS